MVYNANRFAKNKTKPESFTKVRDTYQQDPDAHPDLLAHMDRLATSEQLQSTDVQQALETIQTTETHISDELNVQPNTQELTDLTDQALVHVAEQTIDHAKEHREMANDAKIAVETVLIEGALEATNQRPIAGANPIAVLERDGYNDPVTQAVIELHEDNATLPDGQSVAEVVARELLTEDIERTSNYQGNWTQAQTERMQSPAFIAKFEAFTQRGALGMKDTLDFYDKGIPRAEYLARIKDYTDRHQTVTSQIGYAPAREYGKTPNNLGRTIYKESDVALFSDATSAEKPLNDRQKDIIAAHEMYHALVDPQGDSIAEVRSGFDSSEIWTYNDGQAAAGNDRRQPSKYLNDPSELTARMAQIKNYFGMQGDEAFTQAHLDYARKHYVEDTGLDNNMTVFLRMARDGQFVDLMNSLPV